jgi:diguanylate cyclase (GGDEF)-like protein
MSRRKSRWGLLFFIASVLLAAGAVAAAVFFPPGGHGFFYERLLPWFGASVSAVVMVIGQLSYRRLQSPKVHIAGYLTGLAGLGYFVPYCLGDRIGIGVSPGAYVRVVYLLVFVNGLFAPLLPSSATYRTSRRIAILAVLGEAAVLGVCRFVRRCDVLTDFLSYDTFFEFQYWFPAAWLAAVTALTVRFVREEFHLGGILTGCALFFSAAWMGREAAAAGTALEVLLWAAGLAYFAGSVLFHWVVRIEHRVAYDPLLHIYNRSYCSQIIAEQSSLNVSPPFAVAMVDVDHFKRVNDTHGHRAGDLVLQNVAQIVDGEVSRDGVLCRYGGEELVVFFAHKTSKDVRPIMERVRQRVAKATVAFGRKRLSVTISCGISHRREMGQGIANVIEAADKALYRAKSGGRNQVKIGASPAGRKK